MVLDDIRNFCDFLEKDGFQLKSGFKRNRGFTYLKSTGEETIKIYFAWTETVDFHLHALRVEKRFNSLERIVLQATGQNLEDLYSIFAFPTRAMVPDGLAFETIGKNIRVVVRNGHDAELWSSFVKNFSTTESLHFLESFTTLEQVFEYYRTLESKNVQDFLCGINNSRFVRELALLSLMSPHEVESRYQEIVARILSYEDPEAYQEMLEQLERLHSMLPLKPEGV